MVTRQAYVAAAADTDVNNCVNHSSVRDGGVKHHGKAALRLKINKKYNKNIYQADQS